jgi:hypothetical protein
VVTLQQGVNGYAGCQDTFMYMYAPTSNYCSHTLLKVGERQRYAALVRFDISPLPEEAIITRAVLQLYSVGWSGAVFTIDAFQVNPSVSFCQASWSESRAGAGWSAPGCTGSADRVGAALSTMTTLGVFQWHSLDVTSAVLSWKSGLTPNNGIVVHGGYPVSLQSAYFASADHGTISFRPRLVVTYRLPTGPTNTPTITRTATRTSAPTETPTVTPTVDPSLIPTVTPTSQATATPTPTQGVISATVILRQGVGGYLGALDTDMYVYAPDTNNSATTSLRVGTRRSHASLLRFDLSAIPANATIQKATLELFSSGWSGVTLSVDLFRVLRDSNLTQSTWNQAKSGVSWEIAGCNGSSDRAQSPDRTVQTNSLFQWTSFDVSALVGDWVSGRLMNNGVLLRGAVASSPDIVYFASAQHSNIDWRPRLVVSYQATGVAPTPTPTRTPTRVVPELTPIAATPTAPLPGTETTVVLQVGSNGYIRGDDTQIYIYDPTGNYCTLDMIRVGERRRYVGLMRFDLTPVPSNVTIVRAALNMYSVGWGGAEIPIDVFRLLRPVTFCEASWNLAKSGSPWGTVGCENTTTDREALPMTTIMTSGLNKWHTFDLTQVTQGWADQTVPNYGITLQQGYPALNSGYYFASAQHYNVALRPKLEITYRAR